jgi:hypothetical protein
MWLGTKIQGCCLGKVDWERTQFAPVNVASRYLSLRGKNIGFLNSIANALQIEPFAQPQNFAEVKRAFGPRAVQDIHSAVQDIWPDLDDFERCLRAESGTVTALYTGHYEPEAVFHAVTRLALYCDKIYLVDPFLRAEQLRDKYNPLLYPAEHRATAIKFAFLWINLGPWINADIVNFVRPLDDFIPGLRHDLFTLENEKSENNAELKALLAEEVKRQVAATGPTDRGESELVWLSLPDEALRQKYTKYITENPQAERFSSVEEFLKYIKQRRDRHPYYVDRLPGQTSEFHGESSGACYELAKRMCGLTNSHIVTNMGYRWKEIELDRQSAGIDLQGWSPFAKALAESDLKLLNHVPMAAALRLREEQRLESMRLFFRKVWKSCRDPDEFSAVNAVNFSAELRDEVARANEEWRKIDQELLKWVGTTWGALIVSATEIGFVPAASAAAVTGVTSLIRAGMKRGTFKERFPAGFFLGLK